MQQSIFPHHDLPEKLHIFVDGASRGNPGKAGVGVFGYLDSPEAPVITLGCYFGIATNNVAEYAALALALYTVSTTPALQKPRLYIHADSELMVKQCKGMYKVRNPVLFRWHLLVQEFFKDYPGIITHVRREFNSQADALANEGIDHHRRLPEAFIALLRSRGL